MPTETFMKVSSTLTKLTDKEFTVTNRVSSTRDSGVKTFSKALARKSSKTDQSTSGNFREARSKGWASINGRIVRSMTVNGSTT